MQLNKKQKRITVAIVIGIILVVGGYFLCNMLWNKKPNTKNIQPPTEDNNTILKNTSPTFSKEREYQGMQIKDISFYYTVQNTFFMATVQNNTEKDFEEKYVSLILKAQDGTEYDTITILIPSVKAKEEVSISGSKAANVYEAYDFEIRERENNGNDV